MNVRTSKLSIGTAHFGQVYGLLNSTGQTDMAEAIQILKIAKKFGIKTIDTAAAYGSSEKIIGGTGLSKDFQVISKFSAISENENITKWVEQHVNETLQRLNLQNIYGILLHKPMELVGNNGAEIFKALEKIKDLGKIKKIGISVYDMEELDLIIPRFNIDLVQAPFNIFDRRLERSGWLKKLKEHSIELHTRSAFLQGLLLQPQQKIPTQFSPWMNHFEKWLGWLASENLDAASACLGHLIQFNEIDKIVVGVETAHQLEELTTAASKNILLDMPDFSIEDKNLLLPTKWKK